MPTSFPTARDNLTNPTGNDALSSAVVPHAAQHTNANDAIEALEDWALAIGPPAGVVKVRAERLSLLDDRINADNTGATDTSAAFQAAYDLLPARGGEIFVPPGLYLKNTAHTWSTKCVKLKGAGSGQSGNTGTEIRVPAGVAAITLQNGVGSLGARSSIESLHLVATGNVAGSTDGIRLQASEGALRDLMIEGFAGYGIHVLSSTGAADATINANMFRIDHVRCYNNKTGGYRARGTDSNAGTITNLDVDTNGGFGLLEEAALGNTYSGVHLAGNTEGGIRMGVGGRNQMFGVYYESENKPALRIDAGNSGSNIVMFTNCSRPDGASPIEDNSGAINFVLFEQGGLHWERLRIGSVVPGAAYVELFGAEVQIMRGGRLRFQNAALTSNWFFDVNASNQLVVQSAQGADALFATGNLAMTAVGKGLRVKEGTNAKQGVATLTAGTVTVANTSVTATSRIMLTVQSLGTVTTPKPVAVTARTAGTSFTITSADATDTSVVAYEIFEPA